MRHLHGQGEPHPHTPTYKTCLKETVLEQGSNVPVDSQLS